MGCTIVPLLKEEALPLSRGEVAALRSRLVQPHSFEILDREGRRYLFLRSAGAEPDPVADLEAGVEQAPAWAANALAGCYLVGDRNVLHVPAYTALPLFEARQRLDAELAQRGRAHLDPQYGFTLARAPLDPRRLDRLVVRVPRERVADLAEPDLVGLTRALGPPLDEGRLRRLASCLVVATADHLRLRGADFLDDIAPRWESLRPPPSPPVQEVSVPEPAPEPPAPPTPRRVVDAVPVFELEQQIDAVPEAELLTKRLEHARAAAEARLGEHGYRIAQAPGAPEALLVAERKSRYPRRVGVLCRPALSRPDAEDALRHARGLSCDVLYVVVPGTPEPEALRILSASKVKVIRPEELSNLAP